MGAFIDIASGILTDAAQRVEINAQNIANIPTSGYKRRVAFTELLARTESGDHPATRAGFYSDFTAGKLVETGNALDVAIVGAGFFVVGSADQTFYTRKGSFARDGEGRLVTSGGHPVQAEGGGDIVLRSSEVEIAADGMVLDGGEPVGRIALVDVSDTARLVAAEDGLFRSAEGHAEPSRGARLRQGMIETANVSTGDEMVAMMEALRRAEAGQRLINVYDELMGRAISSFGQS